MDGEGSLSPGATEAEGLPDSSSPAALNAVRCLQMALGARRRRDSPGSVVLAIDQQRLCPAQIVQRVNVGDASGVVQIHKRY